MTTPKKAPVKRPAAVTREEYDAVLARLEKLEVQVTKINADKNEARMAGVVQKKRFGRG